MLLRFGKQFTKQREKTYPKIREALNRRLTIFVDNPFDPQLNNHTLTGSYRGFRSINITGDWRAIYQEMGKEIIFVALGTHSQLYK